MDHDVSTEWTRDEWTHWHACSRCDERFNEGEHNYVDSYDEKSELYNSICDGCHLEDLLGTTGLTYTYVAKTDYNPEAYYIVTGYTGSATEVRIPYFGKSGDYMYKRVKYIKANAFANNKRITKVVIPSCMLEISEKAFMNCTSLAEVEIRGGKILSYAFQKCTSLTQVSIPSNFEEGAFDGCTALQTVTLEQSAGYIPKFAFNGCSALTTLQYRNYKNQLVLGLPNTYPNIYDYAFSGCTSLTELPLDTNIQHIGEGAFRGSGLKSFTLPREVTVISNWLFGNCTSLSSITLHENIKEYGSYAFRNCTSLTQIPFSAALTKIGSYAFWGSGITSAQIPATVTSLGGSMFSDCTSLTSLTFASGSQITAIPGHFLENTKVTSITLPDSVTTLNDYAFRRSRLQTINISSNSKLTSIGSYAFYELKNLKSIYIPKGVTKIGERAFQLCTGLETVTFAANSALTTIGDYAFITCEKLKSIVIPTGVTSIPNYAFCGCYALKTVTLPSELDSIQTWAFQACTSLTTITFPDSVTQIGEMAFSGCKELTNVSLSASISLGNGAFSNCPKLQLTLKGSGDNLVFKNNMLIDKGSKSLQLVTYTGSKFVVPDDGSIVAISNYAFYGNEELVEVVLPECIESIGQYTFAYCPNLKKVNLPSQITHIPHGAFCRSGIESFVFPETIDIIDTYSFYQCYLLFSITFLGNPTTIKVNTFSECYALGEIVNIGGVDPSNFQIPTSYGAITHTDESKLEKTSDGLAILNNSDSERHVIGYTGTKTDIAVPEGITLIKKYAFYKNENITSIIIPEGVVEIGAYAFQGCTSLRSVTLPTTIKKINARAFFGCTSLVSINLPEGLEFIGESAFYNTRMSEIVVPSTVTNLGAGCFGNNPNLTSLTLPFVGTSVDTTDQGNQRIHALFSRQITDLDEALFDKPYSYTSYYYVPVALKTIIVTGDVVLNKEAFINMSHVQKIDVSHATSIGKGTFKFCRALTEIVLSDSVELIGTEAFRGCWALKEITLPAYVKSFDYYLFEDCPALESMVFPTSAAKAASSLYTTVKNLYYRGTLAEYCALPISDSYRFNAFADNVYFLQENGEYAQLSGEIVIPDTVTKIGKNVFYGYTGITSVVLPNTITAIDEYAFAECVNLKEIHFDGTVREWENVTRGNYWKQNVKGLVIICTDGTA